MNTQSLAGASCAAGKTCWHRAGCRGQWCSTVTVWEGGIISCQSLTCGMRLLYWAAFRQPEYSCLALLFWCIVFLMFSLGILMQLGEFCWLINVFCFRLPIMFGSIYRCPPLDQRARSDILGPKIRQTKVGDFFVRCHFELK